MKESTRTCVKNLAVKYNVQQHQVTLERQRNYMTLPEGTSAYFNNPKGKPVL